MLTPDLPVFVQLADSFLQPLLLLLWKDVSQLITSFQKDAQYPLVQLTEYILMSKKQSRGLIFAVVIRLNMLLHIVYKRS